MINFRGTYINPAYVKQLNNSNTYKTRKVSFVELNPYNIEDLDTMNNISDMWGDNGQFAVFMNNDFQRYADDEYNKYVSKFYCLTTQRQHFSHIEPNEVLGVSETDNHINDYCYLQILQTHPDYMYHGKFSNYKHIGRSIIDSLKRINNTAILVDPVSTAVNFYTRCGFVPLTEGPLSNHYIHF